MQLNTHLRGGFNQDFLVKFNFINWKKKNRFIATAQWNSKSPLWLYNQLKFLLLLVFTQIKITSFDLIEFFRQKFIRNSRHFLLKFIFYVRIYCTLNDDHLISWNTNCSHSILKQIYINDAMLCMFGCVLCENTLSIVWIKIFPL